MKIVTETKGVIKGTVSALAAQITESHRPSPSAPEPETSREILEDEIAARRIIIAEAQSQIAALQSRQNQLLPIHRLPVEVLSIILAMTLRLKHHHKERTKLLLVCRAWSNIINENPSTFWTTLSAEDPVTQRARLLRKAGQMPVTIVTGSHYASYQAGKDFVKYIKSNDIPFRELVVRAWGDGVMEAVSANCLAAPAPHLRSLHLEVREGWELGGEDPNSERLWMFSGVAPSLKSVRLSGVSIPWNSAILQNLLSLTLECPMFRAVEPPSIEEILGILRSCPALQSLILRDMDLRQPYPVQLPPLSLDQLTTIDLSVSLFEGIFSLLRHIQFPKTATVSLAKQDSVMEDDDKILNATLDLLQQRLSIKSFHLAIDHFQFQLSTTGLKFSIPQRACGLGNSDGYREAFSRLGFPTQTAISSLHMDFLLNAPLNEITADLTNLSVDHPHLSKSETPCIVVPEEVVQTSEDIGQPTWVFPNLRSIEITVREANSLDLAAILRLVRTRNSDSESNGKQVIKSPITTILLAFRKGCLSSDQADLLNELRGEVADVQCVMLPETDEAAQNRHETESDVSHNPSYLDESDSDPVATCPQSMPRRLINAHDTTLAAETSLPTSESDRAFLVHKANIAYRMAGPDQRHFPQDSIMTREGVWFCTRSEESPRNTLRKILEMNTETDGVMCIKGAVSALSAQIMESLRSSRSVPESQTARDALEDAIAAREMITAEAQAQIVALKSRQNELLAIHRLPVEVLSIILATTLPRDDYSRERTKLLLVCRTWSNIIYGNPSTFWTTLSVGDPLSQRTRLYHKAGLTLATIFVNGRRDGGYEAAQLMKYVKSNNISFRELVGCKLDNGDAEEIFEDRLTAPAPHLRSLDLEVVGGVWVLDGGDNPDSEHLRLFSGVAPELTSVRLSGVSIPWNSAILRGLRSFSLEYRHWRTRAMPSLEQVLGILRSCPDLQFLTLRGTTFDQSSQSAALPRLSLDQLLMINLSTSCLRSVLAILRHIQHPKTVTVAITIGYITPEDDHPDIANATLSLLQQHLSNKSFHLVINKSLLHFSTTGFKFSMPNRTRERRARLTSYEEMFSRLRFPPPSAITSIHMDLPAGQDLTAPLLAVNDWIPNVAKLSIIPTRPSRIKTKKPWTAVLETMVQPVKEAELPTWLCPKLMSLEIMAGGPKSLDLAAILHLVRTRNSDKMCKGKQVIKSPTTSIHITLESGRPTRDQMHLLNELENEVPDVQYEGLPESDEGRNGYDSQADLDDEDPYLFSAASDSSDSDSGPRSFDFIVDSE
ncbi:hypothetical protein FRC04_006843 [Tulasnella sp. 424]|nr:hypothetical protein FRC04_006843 [Tulasnella sp. 424]KAG8960398.1 hypothetical protein FRC05_006957 [Tulasnella sp. 425]